MDKIKLIRLDDQQAYTVKSPYVSFSDIFPNVSNISLDNVNSPQMTNFTGLDEALRSINYTQISEIKKIANVKLTHCKYIVGQHDETTTLETKHVDKTGLKHVICLDWFEITLRGQIKDFSGMLLGSDIECKEYRYDDVILTLDRTGGTKHYKHKLKLYHEGQLFGTIQAIPRDTKRLGDMFQLKISNNILYESEWIERLNSIMYECKWTLNNITRVDIALDGHFDTGIVKKVLNNDYRLKGRCKDFIPFTKAGSSGCTLNGFKLGSKASAKQLTIYNKSLELKSSNKQYIEMLWKNNNLIPYANGEDVHRIELTLKAKQIAKYKENEFRWRELNDANYLSSLMKDSFRNWFEVVTHTGQKNISRETKIEMFDWSEYTIKHIERNKTKPSSLIFKAKRSIRDMVTFGVMENDKSQLIKAKERAFQYGVIEWYSAKVSDWTIEAMKGMKPVEDSALPIAV